MTVSIETLRRGLPGTALALALLTGATQAEEQPVLVPIQRLGLDMAVRATQATIAACRAQGVNISVTLVDRGGNIQVQLRDTLAMPLSLTISEQKAYAAMNFNTPGSALEGRFTSPFSPGKVEGIVLSAGSLPIAAGGTILGGIGVSGAPSGALDEACAQAGLDAIADDLELAF